MFLSHSDFLDDFLYIHAIILLTILNNSKITQEHLVKVDIKKKHASIFIFKFTPLSTRHLKE
jgi:hypothetical protein